MAVLPWSIDNSTASYLRSVVMAILCGRHSFMACVCILRGGRLLTKLSGFIVRFNQFNWSVWPNVVPAPPLPCVVCVGVCVIVLLG